jgi:hypothetical protein
MLSERENKCIDETGVGDDSKAVVTADDDTINLIESDSTAGERWGTIGIPSVRPDDSLERIRMPLGR